MEAVRIEELLRSKSFLEWSPTGKVKPYKEKFGLAKPFIYKGKTYTNLIVDEKHYSPADLAKVWGVSVDLIRDTFRDEPGVLKFDRPSTRTKRGYNTMRIPESVALRVHTRLSAVASKC